MKIVFLENLFRLAGLAIGEGNFTFHVDFESEKFLVCI